MFQAGTVRAKFYWTDERTSLVTSDSAWLLKATVEPISGCWSDAVATVFMFRNADLYCLYYITYILYNIYIYNIYIYVFFYLDVQAAFWYLRVNHGLAKFQVSTLADRSACWTEVCSPSRRMVQPYQLDSLEMFRLTCWMSWKVWFSAASIGKWWQLREYAQQAYGIRIATIVSKHCVGLRFQVVSDLMTFFYRWTNLILNMDGSQWTQLFIGINWNTKHDQTPNVWFL